ncbi:MAG: response regulator [Chitinophagaceae bacterium]|nr:MAG: response regulator [Chitinophagaceae bacterium]
MAEKCILWVDDDTDDLEMFSEAVAELQLGISVLYARNGREALELLEDGATRNALPCLVILDMNMPQMSGRETLVALRQHEHFAALRTIVFTTSENPLDRLTCEKFGVPLYVKPRTYQQLKETIREFLTDDGALS